MTRGLIKINKTSGLLTLLLAIFFLYHPVIVFAYTSYEDCVSQRRVEDRNIIERDPTWVANIIEPQCRNDFPLPTTSNATTLADCLAAATREAGPNPTIKAQLDEACRQRFGASTSTGGSCRITPSGTGNLCTRPQCLELPGTTGNPDKEKNCKCGTWTTETSWGAICDNTSGGSGGNTDGGGSGNSGGGSGGGSGGSTPVNVSCDPRNPAVNISYNADVGNLPHISNRSNFYNIDVGLGLGTYAVPQVVSTQTGHAGAPSIEVGPLLAVTVNKQIPLLKSICTAVSGLAADIKAIRVATESIDATTKLIKKDTGDLVKKEYELDPAVWDAKATAIDAEKTKFGTALENARPQGVKAGANPEAPGNEVMASFTPDITAYEQLARRNAGEIFYAQLKRYYNENDPKNPFKDEILRKIAYQSDQEYVGQEKNFAYLSSGKLLDKGNAYSYVDNLYTASVNKAAQNAVAEYIAGNTIIGGKTCSRDDLIVTRAFNPKYGPKNPAEPKYIDEMFCKPDKLLINTYASAPVVKNLLERFGTTKLTQAEMADEIGEFKPSDVNGITDIIKSVNPAINTNTNTNTTNVTTPPPPVINPAPNLPVAYSAPSSSQSIPTTRLANVPPADSNLASVGSLSKSMDLSLTVTTNKTSDKTNSDITLSYKGGAATISCIATSDWPTFIDTDKYSTITESTLFTIGDIIPVPSINHPQIFTINHPQIFKMSANITAPEVTSIHRQAPTDQTTIVNKVTRNSAGLIQTSTYIPNLVGAEVGDNIRLIINDTVISLGLSNLNPIDLVRRMITEATAGKSDIKKALSNYNFAQDGNMLIVTNKNPMPSSIPSTVTYSIECNISNKVVSSSISVMFP